MKQTTKLTLIASLLFLASCSKEDLLPNAPTAPVTELPGSDVSNPVAEAHHTIRVQASVKVGAIVYDSLPATLELSSWDATGALTVRKIELKAGSNEVKLAKKFRRHQLKLSKWGVTDERTLAAEEIREGAFFSLGGSKAARTIRQELGYTLVQGAWRPQSRTEYSYNADGSISSIVYFQKKPQSAELQHTLTDHFDYVAGRLRVIKRSDAGGVERGFTAFFYNTAGKVAQMHQIMYGTEINADVTYGADSRGQVISIDYLFGNGNTMTYQMNFRDGNKVSDAARSSTGAGEGGSYAYDRNINPFVHLNLPDLYFSRSSKNNLADEQKDYSGSIPTGVPGRFEYVYDEEGYPTEVVKWVKSGATGADLYKTKTVFIY